MIIDACVCISLFQIRLTKHCNSIPPLHTQTAPVAAAPAPAASGGFEYGEYDDKLWDQDSKKDVYNKWDPNSPRSARNFNPFETYKGNSPDASGIYPGEVRLSFLFFVATVFGLITLFGFVSLFDFVNVDFCSFSTHTNQHLMILSISC